MENSLYETRADIEPQQQSRRMGLAERLVAGWFDCIETGRLTIEFPSGARGVFGRGDSTLEAFVKIHDLRVVFRLMAGGDIGLAEGYMNDEWETPDLSALLMMGAVNAEALDGALSGFRITNFVNRMRHMGRANTRRGSRRNIAAHYDLGNDFYRLWLDDSMTYSSGLFAGEGQSLAGSQREKYLRLAQQLELKPGDRVLEIGCGWGGFAELAATEFGCRVVGLTLSSEQAAFAHARMINAGLDETVDIRVQDYRDVGGEYDKIVSIEMFEAVGEDNWNVYFDALKRHLKPGGRAAVQTITIADEHFEHYRRTPDFIQRYIFPGGMLPSPHAFNDAVRNAGLNIKDVFYFGRSYAETLRRWDRAFQDNWPSIERLGFDDRFRRMWRYYFSYCEVGFDCGHIDVGQFLIERP